MNHIIYSMSSSKEIRVCRKFRKIYKNLIKDSGALKMNDFDKRHDCTS